MTNLTAVEALEKIISNCGGYGHDHINPANCWSVAQQALSNQPKTFTIDEIREMFNKFKTATKKSQQTNRIYEIQMETFYGCLDILLAEFEKETK